MTPPAQAADQSSLHPLLKALFDQKVKSKVDQEKVQHLVRAKRNDFFYHGQRPIPRLNKDKGTLDWITLPSGETTLKSKEGSQPNRYNYRLNYFRGDLRKYVGILGHKSPNATAKRKWGSDDSVEGRVEEVNDLLGFLRADWKPDQLNPRLVYSVAKTGTSFIHTYWAADKKGLGEYEEPTWETGMGKVEPDRMVCSSCGNEETFEGEPPAECSVCGDPFGPEDMEEGEEMEMPIPGPPKTYPYGKVKIEFHNALTATCPWHIKCLDDAGWFWLHDEVDAGEAVDAFPQLSSKLGSRQPQEGDPSGTIEFGRQTRAEIASPYSLQVHSDEDIWQRHRVWFKPSYFNYLLKIALPNQQIDATQRAALVESLKSQYPRGIKVTFICGEVVQLEHSALTDEVVEVLPEMNDTLWADAIFNDYILASELMNNAWNLIIKLRDTSIPGFIFNSSLIAKETLKNGVWNSYIPSATDNPAVDLSKAIVKLPEAAANPNDFIFIQKVLETVREIIGLMPAAFGGEGPAQTAEEARRRLNQALLVLSTTWNQIRIAWAKAYHNGCKLIARYSMGHLASSDGTPESVTVTDRANIEDILKGGYEVECDQAIPASWPQVRDFIMEFVQNNPILVERLGVMETENLEVYSEAVGMAGWKVKGQIVRQGVKAVIQELLQGAPVMGAPSLDPMTGALIPGQPQPSVPYDPYLYPPLETAESCRDFCLDPKRGGKLRGTPGWTNVLLFGNLANQALQMAAAPPAPGGPGGGPPPVGPPPVPADAVPPDMLANLEGSLPPEGSEPPLLELSSLAPEPLPMT